MRCRSLLPLVLVGLVGSVSSGCLHANAKTVSDAPPLETPPAPPRVVEIVESAPVPPVTLVAEPPRQPIRPPTLPQPRAEAAQPRPEPPKVEAPAADAPAVTEAPQPRPPSTLQTTPAGAEGEVERGIRVVIARATSDLGRVDYRNLNADARSQYDTAKRFLQQSEDALRPPRNLVFARNLADKASSLAAQLAGR